MCDIIKKLPLKENRLNKKSLFNFVYAIALVGAVISCFGILNELLNVVQLYNVEINNTITVKGDAFLSRLSFICWHLLLLRLPLLFCCFICLGY